MSRKGLFFSVVGSRFLVQISVDLTAPLGIWAGPRARRPLCMMFLFVKMDGSTQNVFAGWSKTGRRTDQSLAN